MSEFHKKFGRNDNRCKKTKKHVFLLDEHRLIGLLVCLRLRLPSRLVAGRRAASVKQSGGRTQTRRTSSDEVKGHGDQMIGTTEAKCVAM